MARPSRYQIMELYKEEILDKLNQINDSVLRLSEVEQILSENKYEWRLPNSTTLHEFLEYLIIKKNILKSIEFGPKSRPEKRYLYTKKNIEPVNLAVSLYQNSYLSHYSAVTMHDLTNEIIKSVYINHEQSQKEKNVTQLIPQENIDKAFSKPMRSTNNFLDYNGQRIYILNGQYTDNLGVIERNGIRFTDIERTLIDITVRPQYSGGVYEVLNIFKRAQGEASVNRITSYLKKLNYSYPYHQAIGFYLERAGYKEHAIKLLENKFSIKNKFYLTYNIPDKSYDERWQIYYPKNL